MAAKKPSISKKDFVLSLPTDMPAADVVTRAKEAGFALSPGYVYTLRMRGNSSSKPVKTERMERLSAPAEALLKMVASEVGLSRAIEVLEDERSKVQTLIGGL